ncbi:hypothetical protein [Virgibacillus siamensis]|uniref:hypothetical protein n=1 Tax=Virgibacillus siamensis TaxID=480071 RepID=UPI000984D7E9|nr:hypothetical protein [Virgibacillus siamensis]
MGAFVRNCRLCKQPMESSPFMLCKTCLVERDSVRSYIAKRPHVSLKEIADSTNVPYEKVRNMVNLGVSIGKENGTQVH